MYDLPVDLDLKQFHGRSLELVCFGTHKADLHLSGGYLIGIEGSVSIDTEQPVELPSMLRLLYPLVSQEIVGAFRTGLGTLSFTFDKGSTLHIHDSNKHYECYSISLKGQTLAIV